MYFIKLCMCNLLSLSIILKKNPGLFFRPKRLEPNLWFGGRWLVKGDSWWRMGWYWMGWWVGRRAHWISSTPQFKEIKNSHDVDTNIFIYRKVQNIMKNHSHNIYIISCWDMLQGVTSWTKTIVVHTSSHLKSFLQPAVPPIRLFLMINMMPLKRCVAKGNYFTALLRHEARNKFLMSGPWLSVAKLRPLSFAAARWRCRYLLL